ncbi:MAG: discoidin domain-containing protein [Eubacteriales bacterium]
MKKFFALLLSLATIVTAVPATVFAVSADTVEPTLLTASSASSSTSSAVVEISSASDLAKLATNLSANARLTGNITITDANWTPIGTITSPFTGTLDGAGYTITYNINTDASTKTGVVVSLFGSLSGTVKNLTVKGSLKASVGTGYVGTIAATLQNGGTLYNCHSSVDLTATAKQNMACGGLVGAVLHNSSSADTDGTIRLCDHSGKMDLTVTDSTASDGTDLTDGTNGACGGILGLVGTTATAEVKKCINTGEINVNGGKYNVGGIVGQTSVNSTTVANITECANKGNITIINLKGERAAGIIGYVRCSTIEYCYNTGEIIAYSDNGNTVSTTSYGTYFGIFGYANLSGDNTLSVQYCYSFTDNPLEAEICTVRNPSYGTFKNFYQSGREEYETKINSNATAGPAGTTFTSAADLTAKLTAVTDLYKANPDGGAPLLVFETNNTLSAGTGLAGYLTVRENAATHDLRLVLSTTASVPSGEVKLTFTGTGNTIEGSFGADGTMASCSLIHADDVPYVPTAGGKIYSLVITGLGYETWTKLTVQITSGGKTILNSSVNYTDLFGEKVAAAIPFASLPDYPDGTVSPIYNCGPGKQNDQTGLTGTEGQMVLISSTSAQSFNQYVAKLTAEGYKKESENQIEDNLFCTVTKGDNLIYLYYTAKTQETRIIWDRSSTTTLSRLSTEKTGTGTTELYQYSIDYTKATGQTWGGDYWQIDCGMCYVIKFADNSVFILDGGHERQSSEAALEAFDSFLHEITNTPAGQKVTIAGWFFSHAHGDHVYFTHAFLEKYHDSYDLKTLYFNIPSYQTMSSGYDAGTFLMKDTVNKYYPNVDDIKLHTGQTFEIQGVGFEVLFTHEDAVNSKGTTNISDFNATSTVLRINIDGKTFMMLGDISTVSENAMCNLFTKATLQSDAVQLAHHNYNNLPSLYPMIAANVILVPNSKENATSSDNLPKMNVALNATTNPRIYYAGDYTYRFTVVNGQIVSEQLDRYTVDFTFDVPTLGYPTGGTTTAEKPVSDSVLTGLTDLNDQIIDKSGVGTVGANGSEAPQCILDDNTATKWCVTTAAPAYVAWMTKEPVTVSAYQLVAGNDTEKFPGRNPKSWVLYGSTDGKTWKVIDAVADGGMSSTNYSASTYSVDSPAAYQYYMLVICSYTSGTTVQIADIKLFGKD